MRRAQAILVILALASLPLILLAQTNQAPACDGMCCVRHPMHSGSSARTTEGVSCHHGAAVHLFECGMHSTEHRTTNAVLAPLPPTMLSALLTLPVPALARDARESSARQLARGFVAIPFEPPRS